MFVPPEKLAYRSLHDAPGGSIMIDTNHKQLLWIVGQGESREAVFLSDEGGPQWYVMPADETRAWSGLVIEAVRLEVDPYSLCEYQMQKPGCLRAYRGKLGIWASYHYNPGGGGAWVIVDEVAGVTQEARFAKWRLVVGEGDSFEVIAEYDAGDITFPALRTPA